MSMLKQGDKIVWWSDYCGDYGRVIERDGELIAQTSMDNSNWKTCPVGGIHYERMVVGR